MPARQVTTTAEATASQALEAATRVLLSENKILNDTMRATLDETQRLLLELKQDKDLIENFIGGMDSLTDRLNLAVDALIKITRILTNYQQQNREQSYQGQNQHQSVFDLPNSRQ